MKKYIVILTGKLDCIAINNNLFFVKKSKQIRHFFYIFTLRTVFCVACSLLLCTYTSYNLRKRKSADRKLFFNSQKVRQKISRHGKNTNFCICHLYYIRPNFKAISFLLQQTFYLDSSYNNNKNALVFSWCKYLRKDSLYFLNFQTTSN